ncbi:hypothetical protein HPG69_016794 [Diceros bicornis minor]|uniref:Uncharacterized protein n=1 Tax=Diceros bicornis minor TaxID=77932 RepID=A0A7J7EBR0_DICBM|nr:hypothetical protein HPG69_016794 [Diceros bicornis minor]
MAAAGRGRARAPAPCVYVTRFGSHRGGGVAQLGGRRAQGRWGEGLGAGCRRAEASCGGELPPGPGPRAPAAPSEARASSARSGPGPAARAGGARGAGGDRAEGAPAFGAGWAVRLGVLLGRQAAGCPALRAVGCWALSLPVGLLSAASPRPAWGRPRSSPVPRPLGHSGVGGRPGPPVSPPACAGAERQPCRSLQGWPAKGLKRRRGSCRMRRRSRGRGLTQKNLAKKFDFPIPLNEASKTMKKKKKVSVWNRVYKVISRMLEENEKYRLRLKHQQLSGEIKKENEAVEGIRKKKTQITQDESSYHLLNVVNIIQLFFTDTY